MVSEIFGLMTQHGEHRQSAALPVLYSCTIRSSSVRSAPRRAMHCFYCRRVITSAFMTGPVGLIAEVEELTDRVEREAQLPRATDERELVEIGLTVAPLSAFGPFKLWPQPTLLIISDGLHLGAGSPRKDPNRCDVRLQTYSVGRCGAMERQAFQSDSVAVSHRSGRKKSDL